MADRTSHTITVVSTNQSTHAAVVDLVEGICGYDEREYNNNITTLSAHQAPCGTSSEIFNELNELRNTLGEFAYSVHEDPKFEWMGDKYIYVPEVGVYTQECDADGEIRISATALDALLETITEPEALAEEIAKLTGKNVRDAFKAYREAAESVDVTAVPQD